ncbi:hypothetical protein E3N88_17971 [Mikania micrantha]|uniref:Uncharacterized protein n=1 Tax=Mikania micrantha TaxID=192012 RepID=A0A5N6NVK5_9ASTR|nr:hypothetical protein E3N88_17971 [Mikania micrantha]
MVVVTSHMSIGRATVFRDVALRLQNPRALIMRAHHMDALLLTEMSEADRLHKEKKKKKRTLPHDTSTYQSHKLSQVKDLYLVEANFVPRGEFHTWSNTFRLQFDHWAAKTQEFHKGWNDLVEEVHTNDVRVAFMREELRKNMRLAVMAMVTTWQSIPMPPPPVMLATRDYPRGRGRTRATAHKTTRMPSRLHLLPGEGTSNVVQLHGLPDAMRHQL